MTLYIYVTESTTYMLHSNVRMTAEQCERVFHTVPGWGSHSWPYQTSCNYTDIIPYSGYFSRWCNFHSRVGSLKD